MRLSIQSCLPRLRGSVESLGAHTRETAAPEHVLSHLLLGSHLVYAEKGDLGELECDCLRAPEKKLLMTVLHRRQGSVMALATAGNHPSPAFGPHSHNAHHQHKRYTRYTCVTRALV